jgi:predicted transcriptional regulator of viral defense system
MEIARIAGRQHGVVSVRQLRAAGLDKFAVMRRVRAGRLHPVHRGVYAVGHLRLSADEKWMAATLALGEGAVVSHRSAASLWSLLPTEPINPIDVPFQLQAGEGSVQVSASTDAHR